MASIRTQIYLTKEQRHALDVRMRRERKSLAQLVREAIDAYLGEGAGDADEAFRAAFGSMPKLEVPSRGEWDRGYG